MNITSYAFSKYLSMMFGKSYSHVDGWKEFANDFTQESQALVRDFRGFRERANKQMYNQSQIAYKGSEVAEQEYEIAKSLKKEWSGYVSKFCNLEQNFENKYKEQINVSDSFMKNEEAKKVFLAEYAAYEHMQSVFEMVDLLGIALDKYENECLKHKPQGQPGTNE